MCGSASRLNASATAASAEACHGPSTRSSSANRPDPTWTHWRAVSEYIGHRRNRTAEAIGKRRHGVAEFADRFRAVQRPIVSENLDGAARDEWRAAEQRHPQLLGRAERGR